MKENNENAQKHTIGEAGFSPFSPPFSFKQTHLHQFLRLNSINHITTVSPTAQMIHLMC